MSVDVDEGRSRDSGVPILRARALRGLRVAGILVLFLAAAAISLQPVLARAGWPINHEMLSWKFRTLVYAFHIAQGDVLPVWSSEDFHGLGTPLPFFYHKLFYLVSGPLFLIFGSIKVSIVLALGFFLVVGAAGIYRSLRSLGLSPAGAALVAAALPFQSYTLFDWLVRGAMAEFSACMIVPWVLFSIITVLRETRLPWHLFSNLLLLGLAHSVLGFLAGLLALPAICVTFWRSRRGGAAAEAKKMLIAVAACGLFLAPWLLTYLRLTQYYDVSVVATGFYHPAYLFRDFLDTYVLSWSWIHQGQRGRWGAQLSPETLVLLVATLIGVVWAVASRGRRFLADEPALCFLLAALLACVLLQLSFTAPVYGVVPGLRFIQFPWRLLGFEQVLALLLIGWGVARWEAARPGWTARALPLTFLLVAVLGSRGFEYIVSPWFRASVLEHVVAPGAAPGAPGIGEYLPEITLPGDSGTRNRQRRDRRYKKILAGLQENDVSFAPREARRRCRGSALPRQRHEPLTLEYRAECPIAATLIVKHDYSGLERVHVRSDGRWRPVDAYRTPEDPRIRLDLPSGEVEVRVRLPRLWHALLP